MKKRMLTLIALFLSFSILCFPRIVLWISWEGKEWFEEMARRFEAMEKTKVEIIYIPRLWEKLYMTLKGKAELPDVCLVKNEDLEMINSFVDLPSLDELGFKEDSFNDDILNGFRINGTVKAVPFYADVQIAYINLDVFKKLNIELPENSWNFDQFIGLLKKIKESGGKKVTPVAIGLFSPYFFLGLQAGLGCCVNEKDIKVDTKENVKLIKILKKMYDERLIMNITRKRPLMVKKFVNCELAILPHGSFLIRKFEEKKVNFTIRVLPYPWKGVIDPKGFVVFRNDEKVKGFLKFLLDNSKDFMEKYIKVPALKDQKLENEYFPVLMKAFKNGVMQPSSVKFKRYWEIMGSVLELTISGKMDTMKALKKAQKYIEGDE